MTKLPDLDGTIDWERLDEWIATRDVPGSGPVTAAEALQGGSQNVIVKLTRGDATMVLRRPPKHLRPNSNDTMLREARVLAALAGSGVPHPQLFAACDDSEVIGAAFYLMAPITGFVPMGELPGGYVDPAWRRQIGYEMVEAAAKLAAVDPGAVGLADFGKAEQWIDRQVNRWRSQLEGYAEMPGYGAPDIPGVDEVGAWIDANKPADARVGIIHGDYQFANVMFAFDTPKLAALIDWELSTLGDPLLDLAWMLTAWRDPGDPEGQAPQIQPWEGMPSRAELVEHYREVSGRDVSDLPWFFALACYKLGILLEGTYARAKAGKAPMEIGEMFHAYTLWLFAKARQSIAAA